MKIVVIYDSRTGNTEKMAKVIAEGAGTITQVEVKMFGLPQFRSRAIDLGERVY